MNATPNTTPTTKTFPQLVDELGPVTPIEQYCERHGQPQPLSLRKLLSELCEENPDRHVIISVDGCDGYAHGVELTEGDLGEPCIEIICTRQFPG